MSEVARATSRLRGLPNLAYQLPGGRAHHLGQAMGHATYIVSPSPTCSPPFIPRYAPLLRARWLVLRDVKESIQADQYIYVGDTESDRDAANMAGWDFVSAHDFEAWLSGLRG